MLTRLCPLLVVLLSLGCGPSDALDSVAVEVTPLPASIDTLEVLVTLGGEAKQLVDAPMPLPARHLAGDAARFDLHLRAGSQGALGLTARARDRKGCVIAEGTEGLALPAAERRVQVRLVPRACTGPLPDGKTPPVARWGLRCAGVNTRVDKSLAFAPQGDLFVAAVMPIALKCNVRRDVEEVPLPLPGAGQSNFIARFGEQGALRWARRLPVPDRYAPAFPRIAAGADGGVVAAGAYGGGFINPDPDGKFAPLPGSGGLFLLPYRADGTIPWQPVAYAVPISAPALAVDGEAVLLGATSTSNAVELAPDISCSAGNAFLLRTVRGSIRSPDDLRDLKISNGAFTSMALAASGSLYFAGAGTNSQGLIAPYGTGPFLSKTKRDLSQFPWHQRPLRDVPGARSAGVALGAQGDVFTAVSDGKIAQVLRYREGEDGAPTLAATVEMKGTGVELTDIAADAAGDVVVIGSFAVDLTLPGGASLSQVPEYEYDAFVAKFPRGFASGAPPLWVAHLAGAKNDLGEALAVHPMSGEVAIAGSTLSDALSVKIQGQDADRLPRLRVANDATTPDLFVLVLGPPG